jgi:N-acylglucosamine-6-phosphate 2-epimerase
MTRREEIIEQLKNGLIVSCQAVPSEPHYMPGITVKMAECAKWAGAVGIRANTPEDVKAIREATGLPVIGIWKIDRGIKEVYLTPTIEAAKALWEAGAEIIACQCTPHIREDGKQAFEIINEIKEQIPEALIFADVRNAEDAKIAAEMGADFVAPTLQSFTDLKSLLDTRINLGTNFPLVASVVKAVEGTNARVIMEGKVNTPEDAVQCLYIGAHAVVVGNAITRPHMAAKRFTDVMGRYQK